MIPLAPLGFHLDTDRDGGKKSFKDVCKAETVEYQSQSQDHEQFCISRFENN